MLSVERNEDPGYDPNWTPPEYGLRMNDDFVLDLIEEVEQMMAVESLLNPHDGGLTVERLASEKAAYELVLPFWDTEAHLVIYEVGQGYGGAEEGGWWFPTYYMVSHHRVGGDDSGWNKIIPWIRTAEPIYRDYYHSLEHGQYGSSGNWLRYQVEVELVPQGWERHNELHGHTTERQGPGKKERVGRPVYC